MSQIGNEPKIEYIEGGHDPLPASTGKIAAAAPPSNETVGKVEPIASIAKVLEKPLGKRAQERLRQIHAGLEEEGKQFG